MKLASEIKNLEIFSLEDKKVIAKVKTILIDPEDGGLVGFYLAGKNLNKKKRALSILSVKNIDNEAVYIDSSKEIEGEKDLPRLYEIIKSKVNILKSKVYDQDGNFLGRITDFAIDLNVSQMTRIYVTKRKWEFFLGRFTIFSYEQVIKIERGKIIVDNDNKITSRAKEIGFAKV